MKNKKAESLVLLFTGLLLLFFAWFILALYQPGSHTDSPRLIDLNSILQITGRVPLAIAAAGIGLLVCGVAIRKFRA